MVDTNGILRGKDRLLALVLTKVIELSFSTFLFDLFVFQGRIGAS